MHSILQHVLLLSAAFAASAASDDADPKFIGYWINGTNTQTINVSNFGSKYTNWTTSSTFAGACMPEGCWIPSGCENALATGINGVKIPCLTMEKCEVMTILQDSSGSSIWAKHSGCQKPNFPYSTLYRSLPSVTASTTTSTEASTSATTSPATPSSYTRPDSPVKTGVDGSDDQGEPAFTNRSKAWIAGPVIGGIAFLALAAAFAFWFGKRAGRKNSTVNTASELPADTVFASEKPKSGEIMTPATSTTGYWSSANTTDTLIHPASELPAPVELADEAQRH